MASLHLPPRIVRERRSATTRHCPAHRAWVRKHRCSVAHCLAGPIECAHVRSGTDGGCGLKPSDRWTISLCRAHHAEQHRIGESAFEIRYGLDLIALAEVFTQRSPHCRALEEQVAADPLPRHGR